MHRREETIICRGIQSERGDQPLVTVSASKSSLWCSFMHLTLRMSLCKLLTTEHLCMLVKTGCGFDSLHPLH